MRIYKSDDEPTIGRISGLYLGGTHTGKSYLLSTWPNPLVVAFDPDTLTLRKMPGVYVLEVESWAEFETAVMPYIQKRALGRLVAERLGLDNEPVIETLGVDTISIGSERLVQHLQGTKDRLTQADYGTLLTKFMNTTMSCVELTRESTPGEPTYHVIFTTHLSTYGDEGEPQFVKPAIKGAFRDILPRLLGFSFLCEHGQMPGPAVSGNVPAIQEFWQVRTSPPDRRYEFGDRIGGAPAGKYKRLPPVLDDTFKSLMNAWGIALEAKS